MKRIFAVIFLLLFTLLGCSAEPSAAGEQKPRIVCTVFPAYDWVREILGEHAGEIELFLLTENGEELHSYQPTAEDMIRIYDCDLFVYVGGESDQWTQALFEGQEKKTASLLGLLSENVKKEEAIEGMEAESDGAEDDEHVWLSLSNAKAAVSELALLLGELDPANAADYAANAEDYAARLTALDSEYRAAAENAVHKTVLFGDRFPFRYLTDDYGLDYYAAFPGCSAETEASFETVIFLAGKADELGLDAILAIEGTQHRIAEAIVQNTKHKDQSILTLNSMQSVTAAEAEDGTTYLSIARENLEVLKKALGEKPAE